MTKQMGSPRTATVGVIEVNNLKGLSHDLKYTMPKKFNAALFDGIRAATIHLSGKIKNLLEGPVLNRQTGTLWRSIQPETYRRAGTVVGIVGTHMEYAPVHEFGATIRAKKEGGLLVFKGSDGKTVAVPEVKIPRRPFFARAFEEEHADASRIIRDEIHKRAVAAFNGGSLRRSGLPAGGRAGVAPRAGGGLGVR